MRCFVDAGFLLTSASRGPSAIVEPLVMFGYVAKILLYLYSETETGFMGNYKWAPKKQHCVNKGNYRLQLTPLLLHHSQ